MKAPFVYASIDLVKREVTVLCCPPLALSLASWLILACCRVKDGAIDRLAMVCGNMEVEVVRSSYIDNLYDNHEDKVAEELAL